MFTAAQPAVVTLTRQELYERVWTVSMRKLAAEYGLSDVGLAKLCDRHEIPKPPVGYWAKLEVGKAPPRPPLLAASAPTLETISLVHATARKQSASPASTDPEIVEALERAKALVIRLPEKDGKVHIEAERATRHSEKTVKPATPSSRQRSPVDLVKCCEVSVSQSCSERAARIVEALMQACDEMGMKVKTIQDRDTSSPHVEFLGECFRFYVREKLKQQLHQPKPGERYSYHKYDYEPRGLLELRLLHKESYGIERSWTDRKRLKIEDAIGEIIEAMVMAVDKVRKRRAEAKQREIDRREAERTAEEKRRQRQEDLASVRNLLDQADRWHAAEALRRYAQAVRHMMEERGPIESDSPADKWLALAGRTADRLDPMFGNDETTLTLDVLYPPPEPRWNGYQQVQDAHRGRPAWLGGWPNWRRE